MPLSDMAVRVAKCTDKPCTLRDEKGLFLFVRNSGCKSWHFRYVFDGKEKRMTFGQYPAVSLRQARDRCEEALVLLATQNLDDLPKSAEPMLNMIEWWVCLVMPPSWWRKNSTASGGSSRWITKG